MLAFPQEKISHYTTEPNPPSTQSSSYSLTTLSSHVFTDGRAVTDMNGRRGRCAAHVHFTCRLWRGVRRGPRATTSFGPQHELPPARLVIHRQTSCQNSVRRGRWKVQTRSGILAYFCPRHHWLWITVELHITVAHHEEADARKGGSLLPCPPSFGLGTTRP